MLIVVGDRDLSTAAGHSGPRVRKHAEGDSFEEVSNDGGVGNEPALAVSTLVG